MFYFIIKLCKNKQNFQVIFISNFFRSQNDFGKQDFSRKEFHEEFIKKHAYQTGTGFGNFKLPFGKLSSSSANSKSSSSGSGYGINKPSQSSNSWSSSYGSSNGQSQYEQPQLAPFNTFDESGGEQYGGYKSTTPPPVRFTQPDEKMCTNKPKTILNAKTHCSLVTKTCDVKCKNNYQLPNGETKGKIYCNAGEWTLEKLDWTDNLACERK